SRIRLVALAVQAMLLERLSRQRPERVEADVQRHPLDVEAAEELRREVQPRRGRRRRARLTCIDRLVTLGIGERLADVRRERPPARGPAPGPPQPPPPPPGLPKPRP